MVKKHLKVLLMILLLFNIFLIISSTNQDQKQYFYFIQELDFSKQAPLLSDNITSYHSITYQTIQIIILTIKHKLIVNVCYQGKNLYQSQFKSLTLTLQQQNNSQNFTKSKILSKQNQDNQPNKRTCNYNIYQLQNITSKITSSHISSNQQFIALATDSYQLFIFKRKHPDSLTNFTYQFQGKQTNFKSSALIFLQFLNISSLSQSNITSYTYLAAIQLTHFTLFKYNQTSPSKYTLVQFLQNQFLFNSVTSMNTIFQTQTRKLHLFFTLAIEVRVYQFNLSTQKIQYRYNYNIQKPKVVASTQFIEKSNRGVLGIGTYQRKIKIYQFTNSSEYIQFSQQINQDQFPFAIRNLAFNKNGQFLIIDCISDNNATIFIYKKSDSTNNINQFNQFENKYQKHSTIQFKNTSQFVIGIKFDNFNDTLITISNDSFMRIYYLGNCGSGKQINVYGKCEKISNLWFIWVGIGVLIGIIIIILGIIFYVKKIRPFSKSRLLQQDE